MIRKTIYPAKGADGKAYKIRMPMEGFRVIPEDGTPVEWSGHWVRAFNRGEIETDDSREAAKKAAQKAQAAPEEAAATGKPQEGDLEQITAA